jgi:hypothetical protein
VCSCWFPYPAAQDDAAPARPALDEDAEDEPEEDSFADLPKARVNDRYSPVSKSPPKLSRNKQRSVFVVPALYHVCVCVIVRRWPL